MKTPVIPLPSMGVDLLSDLTAMKRGTVRVAENVDINVSGTFKRRDGFTTVVPGTDFHSTYADDRGVLVGKGTALFAMDEEYEASFLADMGEGPYDFTVFNGHTYVVSRSAFKWLPSDGAPIRDVGVRLDQIPTLEAHATGSFAPGEYAVSISKVDARGEESGAKFLGVVTITNGLRLTNLATGGYRYRVYVTPQNGDVMYLAAEFDAVFSQYIVASVQDGQPRTTQHLAPMPPGDFVRGHGGRLYVAKDDTLYFSEPLRPHLTDPRHGFIQFVGQVRFFEPVADGIFVGDDRGIWWLPGMDPTKFELRKVSAIRAVRRSSVLVPDSNLPGDVRSQEYDAAVWLSTAGYAVGRPGGSVTHLHPDKVALAADLEGRSVYLVRDGVKQVVTLIAATKEATQAFGVALDSTLQ